MFSLSLYERSRGWGCGFCCCCCGGSCCHLSFTPYGLTRIPSLVFVIGFTVLKPLRPPCFTIFLLFPSVRGKRIDLTVCKSTYFVFSWQICYSLSETLLIIISCLQTDASDWIGTSHSMKDGYQPRGLIVFSIVDSITQL